MNLINRTIDNRVKNNRIEIKIDLKNVSGNSIYVINQVVICNGYCYYDIPTFIKRFKVGEKTIRRRILEAQGKRESWRYFIKVESKIYVSIAILGFKKKNLIGKNRKDYLEFLGFYDWDIFGSLRPMVCPTVKHAKTNMDSFYKALTERFKDASFVFFYVTEQNPSMEGYHSHFVLKCIDCETKSVKTWVNTYLSKYNQITKKTEDKTSVHVENYNNEWRWEGLNYITKQIEKFQDGYDLYSNVMV